MLKVPTNREHKNKGDLVPEIFFNGQIVGGYDFDTSDGLFCEMTVEAGQYWQLMYPAPETTYQSQVAYADSGEMKIWSHPFDLQFRVKELSNWPQMILKVWKYDELSSSSDLAAYGMLNLPTTTGFEEIECPMWTPYGDWKFGALSFYLDSAPRLNNLNIISKDLNKRKRIHSQPTGKVLVELETIRKNFGSLRYTR